MAEPMLSVYNINVWYGAIHAIKDISVNVNEGEIVALIGANGAGKSTTLKTVSGLLRSKTGSIKFMGEDITHTPADKLVGKGLAQVPEGRRAFLQMTVEENLEMGAYTQPKSTVAPGLERVYEQFPRLKERRRQVAGTLSGGEQQMLVMGRALMSNPKLLMLDEPSMGLAPILIEQIFQIVEGLHKAVDIVDEIIATIRACKGGFAEARQAVMDNFGFDELQADAIVKLQLGRLAGLEILKIEQELGELREAIADYEDILANDEHVKRIVKTDLTALADKYGDERRTSIETVSGEVDIEDLIPEETCVFTLTHEGYIKRTTLDTYQAQNRGGRGVQGMTQKDDDFTEELFVGSTHDYMLFMTNQGRVYRLKGYQVPEGSRTAKGSHIVNLLQLQEGEKVTLMLQQKAGVDEDNTYATMVTKQGLIKRTPLSQFRNIRKMGLIAIALNEGDSLVWSHLTKGDDEIIVATHDGAAIRFTEDGARSMGRTGHGVRVIKLREGDYVVGAGVCRPGANVLTISEEGKGRRSRIDDYRITKRGGLGIRNYSNGNVAGIKIVDDTDDLILISQNGILIRIHAADINVQSRYGSGVRVMRLVEDDKVAVVARVDRDNDAETAKIEDTGETDPTPEELAAIEAEELAQEAAEDAAPENETEE